MFAKSGIPTLVTSFKVTFDVPSTTENLGSTERSLVLVMIPGLKVKYCEQKVKVPSQGKSLLGPLQKRETDRLPQPRLLENKNRFVQ